MTTLIEKPKSPSTSAEDFDPFSGGEIARVVPTTEPQMEIWLAAKMQPEASLAYNESVMLRFRGALDDHSLEGAVHDLLDRHEALRATVSPDGLQLLIQARADVTLDRTDLSELHEAARAERLADARRRHVLETFDLENGPLVRAELIRMADTDHALLLTAHHIVCDGWSFGVLVEELGELYSARSAGVGTKHSPGGPDFGDYAIERAAYKETDEYRSLERHWLTKIGDHAPVLELPTDHQREAPRSYRSEREDGVLPPELLTGVRQACAAHGASLFVGLLAAFCVLMQRLSGQRDFVVGVPAAGQNTEGRRRLVGHAVHLLPLRVLIDPDETFGALLVRLRREMIDAFEHQGYTFSSLLRKLMVARDASRPTLISVMFNLDQLLQVDNAFSGLETSFFSNPRAFENFDISVNVVQEGGGLRAECQYGCELFEAPTIRGWLDSYRVILEGISVNTAKIVGDIDLLTDADHDAWRRLNDTRAPLVSDATVWSMFARQAIETPERLAVAGCDLSLSYAQLRDMAESLAARLIAAGARPGERIGISLERAPQMLAALLAILRTGAAYVPLDPDFPGDRLYFMARDARLKLVLTEASLQDRWRASSVPLLLIDSPGESSSALLSDFPEPAGGSTIAYVIYTSGSTGKPKGVCVPHSAVVNFLASMRHEPGIDFEDRLLAVTTLSFDIAVLELLLPLSVGAQVVIATRDEAMDGKSLRDYVERHGITLLQATPSTWRLLMESGWSGASQLKALCGGEPLPADLVRDLSPRVGELWNMYGPTETTVWSTTHRVTTDDPSVPIGHPIANTQVYVLDERRRLCPRGVRGELWIAGDGVTCGYWDKAELTAQRFIRNPFSSSPDSLMYRTGDLGRLRFDGHLECAGRTDFQVKVRGHRIELGEIESVLAAHGLVARCVVDARPLPSGDRALCAYVVWRDPEGADAQGLREHLRQHLPEYMVPVAYVTLNSIPLTPNGKIDRRALPEPDSTSLRASAAVFQPPQTATEIRLAAVWSELLCTPQISRHDNFFDLGGHSLSAMRAIAMMERDTGRRVRPASYVLETLNQIASHYDSFNEPTTESRTESRPPGLLGRLMTTIRRRP